MAGEEGLNLGEGSVDAGTASAEVVITGAPTEEQILAMDPEYMEMVEAEKAASGDDKGGEKPPEDGGGDEPPADDDNTDEPPADGDAEPGKEGDATEEPAKFEDDILPGLTGKQFETLEEPVQKIIAESREALDQATAKATAAQTELDKLLKDPIVLHRKGVIEGKNDTLPYKVPEIKDETVAEMQRLIDQDTPESKTKFNELLKNHISSVTDIVANNVRLAERARFEDERHTEKAGLKLLALAKLAKIELPSDDPNVLVNTDFGKLGDIGKVLIEIGERTKRGLIANPKKYLAEVDAEELYAQMAIKNKWPLLKNADKIISKQVKESNEKLLNKFLRGKADEGSGTFAKGGQMDQRSSSSKTVREGVDLIKLATDDKYHETLLNSKQNDPKWFDKVATMRQEGERMIEDNPKLNAPRK